MFRAFWQFTFQFLDCNIVSTITHSHVVWLITNLVRPLAYILCWVSYEGAVGGIITNNDYFPTEISRSIQSSSCWFFQERCRRITAYQSTRCLVVKWKQSRGILIIWTPGGQGTAMWHLSLLVPTMLGFGVLYTHGIVGCTALAVAFLWRRYRFADQSSNLRCISRVALNIILCFTVFTTAENRCLTHILARFINARNWF
jgi:hypothetical protein